VADVQQSKGHGFMATVTKRALAPIVSAAATAATAYLMRKAAEVWEEKLQPKIEEKGGGRAVARDTLETAADKVGGPASEQLSSTAEKLGDESDDSDREQERRRREQRRKQRRKALEQTGSS
jgi:hypothetical protein